MSLTSVRQFIFIFKLLNNRKTFLQFTKQSRSINSSLDIINKDLNSTKLNARLTSDSELTSVELNNVLTDQHIDWTEKFGTLSPKKLYDRDDDEDDDDKPYVRLSKINRKHAPDWYARKITKLGQMKKVYEAIAVLEEEMLVTDRVMPNEFVFTSLIGVLGRVGYTKKAFSLFNKMKKFGIVPTGHTYTALFNCCSNSPDSNEGLILLNKLRTLMIEKEIEMNQITFQAMLKAYAHLGDVHSAFKCVDDGVEAGLKINDTVFSFLLMACISDKINGFNLAIRVWSMILNSKVDVTLFHFNLILKSARDCGAGNENQLKDLISLFSDSMLKKTKTKLQIKNILPQSISRDHIIDIDPDFSFENDILVQNIDKNDICEVPIVESLTNSINLANKKSNTSNNGISLISKFTPINKEIKISNSTNKAMQINTHCKDLKLENKYTALDFSNLPSLNIKPSKKSFHDIYKESKHADNYNAFDQVSNVLQQQSISVHNNRNTQVGKSSEKQNNFSGYDSCNSMLNIEQNVPYIDNILDNSLNTNCLNNKKISKNDNLTNKKLKNELIYKDNNSNLEIDVNSDTSVILHQKATLENNALLPINLLLPVATSNNIKSIKLPLKTSDKLALLGGLQGFVETMDIFKIEPNLKTISLLLDLLGVDMQSGAQEEIQLLEIMEKKKIQPDLVFYNALIRKRNLRRDFNSAKEVLSLMCSKRMEPTLHTFGCLAMGCIKKDDALLLISDMRKLNLVPNIEISEILLFQSRKDFDFKLEILKMMQRDHVRPNASFLGKLDEQVAEARKIITRLEQGKEVDRVYLTGKFRDGYRRFALNYKTWLQQMELEPAVHPWDPFKQPTLMHNKE